MSTLATLQFAIFRRGCYIIEMRRESQSIADLLVEVVSPLLITLLVSSLVCFVVEVLYQGQYNFRLQAILCLFVMGTVGTARISLTDGASYAAMFAAPLGIVTLLALIRFVEFGGPLAAAGPLLSTIIMFGIWWCSHQLTIDSTLVERDRDQTGTGLLSQLGWEHDSRETATAAKEPPTPTVDGTTTSVTTAEPTDNWWERFVSGKNRPHTPGTWAFYFSLAALPIFGIGQWFLPSDDLAGRRWVFQLAIVYVACALGLLLSTSFLGLRRYLRQRRLELPLEMAAGWLILGSGMIAAIMLIAFLLPRPMPEYSLAQLLPNIGSQTRSTSSWSVGKEGVRAPDKQPTSSSAATGDPKNEPGKGAGTQPSAQPGGDKSADSQGDKSSGNSGDKSSNSGNSTQGSGSKSGEQGSAGGKSGEKNQGQQNQSSNDKQASDQRDKTSQSDSEQKNEQSSGGKPDPQAGTNNQQAKSPQQFQPRQGNTTQTDVAKNQPANNPSPPPASQPTISSWFANLPDLLNRLGMLIALLVAAYFAWQYREHLRTAWQKLVEEWHALLARLFGRRNQPVAEAAAVAAVPPPPPRPFASFQDPFATGQANQWSPVELLRYSLAALEAWGREHACERQGEQTPLEYAQSVAVQQPSVAMEVQQFAQIYSQVAYGPPASTPSLDVVRQFWQRLRNS